METVQEVEPRSDKYNQEEVDADPPHITPSRPTAVQLMPSSRGGPSPRTRTISPNKPIRKEEERDEDHVTFEQTLRSEKRVGDPKGRGKNKAGRNSTMSASMRNAPDLPDQDDWYDNESEEDSSPEHNFNHIDFLKESQNLDKVLTLAGKRVTRSHDTVDNSHLAQSRFEHAKMYHQINNLPKSKAEIYNQLVDVREQLLAVKDKYKKERAARQKASVMFKLEKKKNKDASQLEIKQAKELRELRNHRREANLLLKSTIADFNNYKNEKELELIQIQQEGKMEQQKLQESLLTEQQQAAQHFARNSESREKAHTAAMMAKAEELAKQRAEIEKHKIELENKFLNKIKQQKTGFGSEKNRLQDKLKAARLHLQTAREKAMGEKELEMLNKHTKEIEKLQKEKEKELAAKDKLFREMVVEKDKTIDNLKASNAIFETEKTLYIRVLEGKLRDHALTAERRMLKHMDDEYDYLAQIGIPEMDVEMR